MTMPATRTTRRRSRAMQTTMTQAAQQVCGRMSGGRRMGPTHPTTQKNTPAKMRGRRTTARTSSDGSSMLMLWRPSKRQWRKCVSCRKMVRGKKKSTKRITCCVMIVPRMKRNVPSAVKFVQWSSMRKYHGRGSRCLHAGTKAKRRWNETESYLNRHVAAASRSLGAIL